VTVFGPQTFHRADGSPDPEIAQFSLESAGDVCLVSQAASQGKPFIYLDGEQIANARNFNDQFDQQVHPLAAGPHELSVNVVGQPGSSVVIEARNGGDGGGFPGLPEPGEVQIDPLTGALDMVSADGRVRLQNVAADHSFLSEGGSTVFQALTTPLESLPGKERLSQRDRVEICFGFGNAGWDAYKVLERYELLYEARLIAEYWADRGLDPAQRLSPDLGSSMAFDHRRMLATGLGRIRGKLRYRPVAFELLPETFTLLRLQQVVESLSGLQLHKQNFRRFVERSGLVEGTGLREARTGGRPAELFRFRRAVLRERRAPGVASLQPPREI